VVPVSEQRNVRKSTGRLRLALAHLVDVIFATGKSMVPEPPPTSTRILTSSRFPIVMPAAFHPSKCWVTLIVPHWRAFCRTLQNCNQLETPEHLEPPVPFVLFE